MFAFKRSPKRKAEIAPDEIFLDSRNLPDFDTHQFEGRIERPIGRVAIIVFATVFVAVGGLLLSKTFTLQIVSGEEYREQAENNRLSHSIIFPDRGVIYDQTGTLLAWNELTDGNPFAMRSYAPIRGLSHVLGYVTYPKKDTAGFYYQDEIIGVAGVEKTHNEILAGARGVNIIEEDARGDVISTSVMTEPEEGSPLTLTIDAGVQDTLGALIDELASDVGFTGGASAILDVRTGGLVALVSIPDVDPNAVSRGDAELLEQYTSDPDKPFLNRAIGGRYTPGSIIKPFIAIGALSENVIDPETEIYSDGALRIPNPYDPDNPTIMRDWKAHGWTDLREALAVSSDVYFYQVGGGFEDQQGLGIKRIEEYVRMFAIGEPTGIDLEGEVDGTIPSIEWKRRFFPDDPWRVGDTYNTAIGQYGFQTTAIQMARATAAIANDGLLVTPHLVVGANTPVDRVDVDHDVLQIVREGMRRAVTNGTAAALNLSQIEIAAKTGTAELGAQKQNVNSWIIGFWPYEQPRYAFATVMERGPATNLIGSASVMRRLFDWMAVYAPHYLER